MTPRRAPSGPFAGVTLDELTQRLRRAEVSAAELAEAALAAAGAAQDELNAFTVLDPAGAQAAAGRADAERARGVDRGSLHGIPVAVKDLIDTAGLATEMGSRQFAGRVPARDAACVARLRDAGAVLVGKTTTHEVAYGPTGDVAAGGPGRNPHDPGRMAGGSSAGSAAAVADGLVPLALGTDTGGSVRIPAALCGAVGLRPSPGRIAAEGVLELSWTLDAVGPMAGSVADVALAFGVLAGAPGGGAPSAAGLRVGVCTGAWFERVAPEVAAALRAMADRLADAGATVRETPVPDAGALAETYRLVQSAEAVAVHAERLRETPESFEPETLERLRVAAEVPAWAYARARRELEGQRTRAGERLDGLDVLLLPTVPITAPPVGARDSVAGGAWRSPREALLAFCSPWSVLGLPCLSLPAPVRDGALPVGLQLVGRPGGDETLLAAAAAIEAANRSG